MFVSFCHKHRWTQIQIWILEFSNQIRYINQTSLKRLHLWFSERLLLWVWSVFMVALRADSSEQTFVNLHHRNTKTVDGVFQVTWADESRKTVFWLDLLYFVPPLSIDGCSDWITSSKLSLVLSVHWIVDGFSLRFSFIKVLCSVCQNAVFSAPIMHQGCERCPVVVCWGDSQKQWNEKVSKTLNMKICCIKIFLSSRYDGSIIIIIGPSLWTNRYITFLSQSHCHLQVHGFFSEFLMVLQPFLDHHEAAAVLYHKRANADFFIHQTLRRLNTCSLGGVLMDDGSQML